MFVKSTIPFRGWDDYTTRTPISLFPYVPPRAPFGRPSFASDKGEEAVKSQINLTEEGATVISIAAPGVSRKDFTITLDDTSLSVNLFTDEAQLFTTSFVETFTVERGVDTESISARYRNGVLAITIQPQLEPESTATTIVVQ